jgi:hypothetical protein
MITVADLIERLKAFPADMPVFVSGFDECGLDPLKTIKQVKIVYRGGGGHAGAYDLVEDMHEEQRKGEPFKALHLNF